MLDIKEKKPADVLDYPVQFDRWITDDDTLTSVETGVDLLEAGGLTVNSAHIDGLTATLWLSGGLDKHTYVVTVTVATQAGRVKEEQFTIRVRERS